MFIQKKTSKKIAEVKDVISLEEEELEAGLVVKTNSGEMLYFNTNEVKTTEYQNRGGLKMFDKANVINFAISETISKLNVNVEAKYSPFSSSINLTVIMPNDKTVNIS